MPNTGRDRPNLWSYNPSDLFSDIGDAYTGARDWLGGMFTPDEPTLAEPSVQERVNQIDLESPEALSAMQAMRDQDYIEALRRKAGLSAMPLSILEGGLPEVAEIPEILGTNLPSIEAYEMPEVSTDSKIALRMARELAQESEGMFKIPTIQARSPSGMTPAERMEATYGMSSGVDMERDLLQTGFRDVGQPSVEVPPEPTPRVNDIQPDWLRNAERIREQNIVERGQWQGSDEELAMKRLMEIAGY